MVGGREDWPLSESLSLKSSAQQCFTPTLSTQSIMFRGWDTRRLKNGVNPLRNNVLYMWSRFALYFVLSYSAIT